MTPPRKSFLGGCCLGTILGPVLIIVLAFLSTGVFHDTYIKWFAKDLKPPKIATGTVADYTLKLKKGDGTPYDFAATKGKAVFLNFWSTNCPHCESELEAIEKLYQSCYGFGVEFLCVAIDDPGPIPDLIQKYNLTVPIYTLDGKRPPVFDSDSAPLTFIITPPGDIALRLPGAAKWDDISAAALLKLLSTVSTDTK